MRRIIAKTALLLMLAASASANTDTCTDAYKRGDHSAAFKECRLLAERGNASAQYRLGLLYSTSAGALQDDVEAVRWWRKAAERGHVRAQYGLGLMYQGGFGVPQDYVQAHKWYDLAAFQAEAGELRHVATKNLEIVARRMTPAQITEAQRLSRAWRTKQSAATPTSSTRATALTRQRIARVQRALSALGYDTGPWDGILGPKTRAAIRAVEARGGLPVTGTISDRLETALRSADRPRR